MLCLRHQPVVSHHGSWRMITNCIQQANFLSFPGGSSTATKRKQFTERRIMGFGMEQMFDVIQDVEKYQDFLPWCHSSVVTSKGKGFLKGNLVVGIPPFVESYTSNVTLVRPLIIKAESTKGKLFKELTFGNPQSCIIDYNVSLEFRSTIASQAANVFFNQVVRAMTEAFYNEAKKRYGPESVPSRKLKLSEAVVTAAMMTLREVQEEANTINLLVI
ncbi:Coenzyme Q-binding protein COQ10 A, mitochondrial [Orchesella cincta]|uniref:Coenzyme Q-binding protein COQ10 A, mitochondrial n=1 Tax=Orchesella cincta TaxID=48709 RepID=A0A1D2N5Y8_ORCCI|nr:Coenzyme Q-binding protein COQ10 A, mitochondrial [Orchesella cincta]